MDLWMTRLLFMNRHDETTDEWMCAKYVIAENPAGIKNQLDRQTETTE